MLYFIIFSVNLNINYNIAFAIEGKNIVSKNKIDYKQKKQLQQKLLYKSHSKSNIKVDNKPNIKSNFASSEGAKPVIKSNVKSNAKLSKNLQNNKKKKGIAINENTLVSSPKYASLIIDCDTNQIIHSKNHHKKLHPASLTKMMTLYITFKEIRNGNISLNEHLIVSRIASKRPKTNLNLRYGEKISTQDAILALSVKSANDASYVLAERIGGNVSNFVKMMNQQAEELGMKNTYFKNPDGWHHIEQYTTAYDMALLGIALKEHHPKYYHYFNKTYFIFKGQIVNGHNRVLAKYPGANGLKTGYVDASGFNLVTSTKRPDGNLIAVVMGCPSSISRDRHMIKLLEDTYAKRKYNIYNDAYNDDHLNNIINSNLNYDDINVDNDNGYNDIDKIIGNLNKDVNINNANGLNIKQIS